MRADRHPQTDLAQPRARDSPPRPERTGESSGDRVAGDVTGAGPTPRAGSPFGLLQGAAVALAETHVDLRCRWGGQVGDGGEAADGGSHGVRHETFDVDVVGGGESDPYNAVV